jgi:hypothetical protein
MSGFLRDMLLREHVADRGYHGGACALLGVSRRNFPELAERKIIMPGSRKGTYALEPSVSGYAKHLRRLAQGRHGTEERLSTAEVEALWHGQLLTFHNRILAVPRRVPYLSARQTVVLTQELRDCLTELADKEKGVTS